MEHSDVFSHLTRGGLGSIGAFVALALALARASIAQPPIAELPLDFDKGLPLASFLVKGAPVLFILDSAAVGCVVDEPRAAQLGIEADDSALSSGSGGTIRVGLAHGLRLAAQELDIVTEFAVLTPLGGLGLQKPVGGVLGLPLFGKFVVEIDYAGRRARVFDPRGYEPEPGAEVVRMWMTDGPTVRGRLSLPGGEDIDADFQLDTGSSHVLTVCKPLVDRRDLLRRVPGLVSGQTRGIGGVSPDKVGRVARVSVGRFSLEEPEVRFSTHAAGTLATERYDANLGNGFLSRHVVTFDVPHGRLILAASQAKTVP